MGWKVAPEHPVRREVLEDRPRQARVGGHEHERALEERRLPAHDPEVHLLDRVGKVDRGCELHVYVEGLDLEPVLPSHEASKVRGGGVRKEVEDV
jgi:hypothetical protein